MPSAIDAADGQWPRLLLELGGHVPPDLPERWAPVLGFEGLYGVSTLGQVRSLSRSVPRSDGRFYSVRERIMRPAATHAGYLHVVLRKDNTPHTRTVHRLVLESFVCTRPAGLECCHRNGNPADNRLSNLRWDSPLSNGHDRKRHGTANQGFSNPRAFLSPAQIIAIRKAEGTIHGIAKAFGISSETVRRIRNGNRWSFVEAA